MAVWTILYISDYALTICSARLYRANARDKIVFQGSYELTPYFQRDIDALKRISPRFVLALAWTLLLQGAVYWLAVRGLGMPDIYFVALGAMVLLEMAVHIRHVRNLFTFRAMAGDVVRGRIEYDRSFMLRTSATELFAFSGAYLVLFALTGSFFVLGGALGCVSTATKHVRMSRLKAAAPTAAMAETSQIAAAGD